MGDVKMLAMLGAFLGWQLMLLTLVLSSLVGSVVGLGMIVTRRGRHEIRAAVRDVSRRGGDAGDLRRRSDRPPGIFGFYP